MVETAQAGSRTVAILDVGVMGSTLLAGLLRSGRDAADLVITGRNAERAEKLAGTHGVRLMSNVDAAVGSDTLVLVVKPQDMGGLLAEISAHAEPKVTPMITCTKSGR